MAVAAAFVLCFTGLAAQSAHACSVCFGDPESPQTAGMNAAIGTLLGVTLMVLAGVAIFGGAAAWRFAHQNAPDEQAQDGHDG